MDNFKKLLHLIAPKTAGDILDKTAESYYVSPSEAAFLHLLLKNKWAVLFDNTIGLDELLFHLKTLILENHLKVDTMADVMDEYGATDDMLNAAGKVLSKQGWIVCDFNEDPKIYHLSIVPAKSKGELETVASELKLYVQFFG